MPDWRAGTHAGMPMHLVNCMGTAGTPDERFIDVFRGGQLLTRWLHVLHQTLVPLKPASSALP